ncbi:MAG: histidinol-phosphatase HisJ family protein [Chloroflexi bacterium]|nr:histidinol-phosphatase HisJ family protein [Chloroflexota bacterium]
MIPHDYHLHTRFSCDCKAEMAEMCRSAIEKGIPEIGFTEHYDLHPAESCRDWFRPEAWWDELESCRAQFAGQLVIRAGVELGEPHIFPAECRSLLARYPFDYCLGSLHWVGPDSIFDRDYFERTPMDEGYRRFFTELERMTRVGGFDVLSHFDVVLRHGVRFWGAYDPTRYEDWIRPVLENCIRQGIALDLNTAVVRRFAAQLTPGVRILTWYREMGGERLTLGSDSHRPENVGADLDRAIAAAREAGFTQLTRFEARRPRQVLLPGG